MHFCVNLLPARANDSDSPFQRWFGYSPPLKHLRVFGCLAYVFLEADKRKKLERRARKMVFVGYPRDRRGYKLLDCDTLKPVSSHTVVFDESHFPVLPTIKQAKKNRALARQRKKELQEQRSTGDSLGESIDDHEAIAHLYNYVLPMENSDESTGARNVPGGQSSEIRGTVAEDATRSSMHQGVEAQTDIMTDASQHIRDGGEVGRDSFETPRPISVDSRNWVDPRQKKHRQGASALSNSSAEGLARGGAIESTAEQSVDSRAPPAKRARTTSAVGAQHANHAVHQVDRAVQHNVYEERATGQSNLEENEKAAARPEASSSEGTVNGRKREIVEVKNSGNASSSDCIMTRIESRSTTTRSGRRSKPPRWMSDFVMMAKEIESSEEEARKDFVKSVMQKWHSEAIVMSAKAVEEPATLADAMEPEEFMQ